MPSTPGKRKLTPEESGALFGAIMESADAHDARAFDALVQGLPMIPGEDGAFLQEVVAVGFREHAKKRADLVKHGDTARIEANDRERQRRMDLLRATCGDDYVAAVEGYIAQQARDDE